MSYRVTLESSYKNQYDAVGLFHEVFGHPHETEPIVNIFDVNMKLVEFRISLIAEEVGEFVEAIKKNNLIEAVDAVCDTLYVVNGAYHAIGGIYRNSTDFYEFALVDQFYHSTVLELESIAIENSIQMLQSLVNGLKTSATNHDFDGFLHVLQSLQHECYRIANTLGFNVDQCFNIVQSSNMSKVCTSESDARVSVDWYVHNDDRYAEPAYRESSKKGYWIIFNNATSKILKSRNFVEPEPFLESALRLSCVNNQCDSTLQSVV